MTQEIRNLSLNAAWISINTTEFDLYIPMLKRKHISKTLKQILNYLNSCIQGGHISASFSTIHYILSKFH